MQQLRHLWKTRPALLILLGAGLLIYILLEARDKDDYWIFYSGSRDLFAGENIYTKIYNQWYHYLYSLFFAIVLYPLALLPYYLSKVIWLLLNLFFLHRIFALLFSYFEVSSLSRRQQNWFYALSFLFCIRFINDNFHCGQITLFMLYICLQSIEWIKKKRNLSGALLLAFGINIKLMPLVLVPYLFYRNHFKAGMLTLVLVILMYLIPFAVIGSERTAALMDSWWQMMNPSNREHIVDTYDRGFHGISTFFSVYFYDVTPDPNGYGTKINVLDLSLEQLNMSINLARLILVCGTLYLLSTRPFKNETSPLHRLYELSYILAIIPLIFPHQQFYAFIFQLPAVVLLIYQAVNLPASSARRKFLVPSLVLIFLTFNLQLLLGEFTKFYEHFKILTFGAFLLLILLAAARRSFISKPGRQFSPGV